MPDAAATRTSQNIKRSVQDYLASLNLGGAPILYDAPLELVPKDGTWVDVIWRRRTPLAMASPQRGQSWALELQCWSRIKDDPMQANLDALVDKLLAALDDGQADKYVPLCDFTNPAAPVDSGYKVRLSVQSDDYLPSTDLVYGRSIWVTANYFERY